MAKRSSNRKAVLLPSAGAVYHGPDQRDIDELNAVPDHDPAAMKEFERRRVANARRAFRVFLLAVLVYFAATSLYQYVIAGVFMWPGIEQYKLGHVQRAQSELETYLRWSGADSNAHYYLGMCLYTEGRPNDALQQFELDTTGIPVRNREVMQINKRSRAMIDRIE